MKQKKNIDDGCDCDSSCRIKNCLSVDEVTGGEKLWCVISVFMLGVNHCCEFGVC